MDGFEMMSDTLKNCPTCQSELKSGAFSSNAMKPAVYVKAINIFTEHKHSAFCDKCGNSAFKTAILSRETMVKKNNDLVNNLINLIPVVTLQNPHKWDYDLIKIVTAQSVTGEGALTEFASSWSEFFGTQSNRLSNKLKGGEDICFAKIRLNAAIAGANAVIGVDIDYAEVGGTKGMLMVCMSGTAIKINNLEVLNKVGTEEKFVQLAKEIENMNLYNSVANLFQQN